MSRYEDSLGSHRTEFVRLPQHAAGDATVFYPVMKVPDGKAIVVEAVTLWPEDAVVGADTNTHHANCVSKTAAGGAGVEVANKDFVLGVGATAATPYDLTLTTTTANRKVTESYVIGIEYEKIGNGGAVALGDQLCSIRWRFAD